LIRSASVDRLICNFHEVTFEVLRVFTMNIAFFGDVIPCSLVTSLCSCYK
jgi:hypothetical protein